MSIAACPAFPCSPNHSTIASYAWAMWWKSMFVFAIGQGPGPPGYVAAVVPSGLVGQPVLDLGVSELRGDVLRDQEQGREALLPVDQFPRPVVALQHDDRLQVVVGGSSRRFSAASCVAP